MKAVVLFILSATLIGCSATRPRIDPDYVSIAEASLKIIERNDKVVAFVVPQSVDPRVRSALGALRKIVSPNAVPQSAQFTLPEGYFELSVFSVAGNSATFAGKLGPQWRATSPNDIMGCGVNYSIPYARTSGSWHNGPYEVLQC